MHFNDSGLIPFTNYRYRLQAHNQFGFTESPEVMFRTLPSSPSGDINLTVSDVRMNSASFLWNEVSDDTGVIGMYGHVSLLSLITHISTSSRLSYI